MRLFFMLGGNTMKNTTTRILTEGALLVAAAVVLSLIPLFRMPWGGSIDLAMLPLLIYCVRRGMKNGLIACFVFSIVQIIIEGGVAIGWQSIIGDFIVAYTVLGFAGIFKGKYVPACLLGVGLRFLVHYVVGATIWAEYMPESFFSMTMTTPWVYSALYNGAYLLPDLIAILVIFAILMNTPAKKIIIAE